MSYIKDKILKLTKQLYPTGRAWKIPFGGFFESLHKALAVSEEQAYNDAVSFLDSMLPDNNNFTTDDATDWERRLGLPTNLSTSLSNRKAAILRKMNAPGINPAKCHYLYLQEQLQLAGFNVYVYENIYPVYPSTYINKAPDIVFSGGATQQVQHGMFQHGDVQHDLFYYDIIANSIDEFQDQIFSIGNNLRSTFFISGNPIATDANVPLSRKAEFRQLILQLKQVQTIGFLNINYI